MRYVTTSQLASDVFRLAKSLPDNLSAIAGIPRSGMLPATLLANYLHLPLLQVHHKAGLQPLSHGMRLKASDYESTGPIVVIDDSVRTGKTLETTRRSLSLDRVPNELIYSVVYAQAASTHFVDLVASTMHEPYLFEWNLFNCDQGDEIGFDLDGVLCPPFEGDSQNVEEYLNYLRNVRPRWLPRRRDVHLIASPRSKAFLPEITSWLSRYKISVRQLELVSGLPPQEQLDSKTAGEFKARSYADSNCQLFIEPNESQAKLIYEASGKAVLCPSTSEMFE